MSNYYGLVNGLLYDTRQVLQAYTLQMNTLLRAGFQCRGGVWLSGKMDAMASAFQQIDNHLCSAAKAASTMDMDVYSPAGMKWNISQRVKSSATIRMDYSTIDGVITALRKIRVNMAKQTVACAKAISTLSAAQYKKQSKSALLTDPLQLAMEKGREDKFLNARNLAVSKLSSAKKIMLEANTGWDAHAMEIEKVKSAFAAADSKVKAKLSEYNAGQAIAESKAYTKVSNSKDRAAVEQQVEKLKAVQADYKATHDGKESAELNKEITRLNKLLPIKLASVSEVDSRFTEKFHSEGWLNQHSDKFPKGNARCACCAYAFAIYMVTGKINDPNKYWKSGIGAVYKDGHTGFNSANPPKGVKVDLSDHGIAKAAYDNLEKGKPVMLHYTSKNTSGHWVTVIGIKPGADISNLKISDLLVYNPAGSETNPAAVEQYLDTSKSTNFHADQYICIT